LKIVKKQSNGCASDDGKLKQTNFTRGEERGTPTKDIIDKRLAGYPHLIAIYHCHPRYDQKATIPSGCLGNRDQDYQVANTDDHKSFFYLVGTFLIPDKKWAVEKYQDFCQPLAVFEKGLKVKKNKTDKMDTDVDWQLWVVFNNAAKKSHFASH